MQTVMDMHISGVTEKNNEKIAYVRFEEGELVAEGSIPDCKITKNQGFTDEEVRQLECYLIANLAELKRMAAGVNPIRAMLDEK